MGPVVLHGPSAEAGDPHLGVWQTAQPAFPLLYPFASPAELWCTLEIVTQTYTAGHAMLFSQGTVRIMALGISLRSIYIYNIHIHTHIYIVLRGSGMLMIL